jgi:hypothetical protein
MKTLAALMALVLGIAAVSYSQNINWRSLRDDQSNVVRLTVGYDFGATAQLGYSRSFNIGKPVVVGLDCSVPMGSDALDDFKIVLGGQIELVQIDGFSATITLSSIFRRFQSQLVRIESFGSDFGILAGYYVPTWFVAGEFGFDKSITSHLTHSDVMRAVFPGIKDGWYLPSGGNYYYGIQAGKTLGESFELSLRVGRTDAQGNDENAVVPLYLRLGFNVKF